MSDETNCINSPTALKSRTCDGVGKIDLTCQLHLETAEFYLITQHFFFLIHKLHMYQWVLRIHDLTLHPINNTSNDTPTCI